MYTIGEISKIVNISTNALRYYDEIGLLKPSLIQDNNQYRYYTDKQIKDITFIIELKQYGFTLDEIKELVKNRSNKKLKGLLEEKQVKMHNEIARLKDSSILLEKRILEIIKEEESKMKSGKILIVDDLELARIMIKNIIEDYGYTIVGEAGNGEEALSAYEELKPDLVIMDITMPKMDGIDATRKIIEKYQEAKIVICSAMSYGPIILESIKAGAKDFVSKPITNLRLINAMTKALEDKSKVQLEKINYVHRILTKQCKETAFSRTLNQDEVDELIYKITNESEELIRDFFNKINSTSDDKSRILIGKSAKIDEKIINQLKEKFLMLSAEISSYLSVKFNNKYLMKLLTVENITMSEFKTLINASNSTGIIRYEAPYLPIHINLHGGIKNGQEIIKELLDITANKLNSFLTNYQSTDILLSSDKLKEISEDYPTVLISFGIETDKEEKGFVEINIPHNIL